MTPAEYINARTDALLASYIEKKSEISRRSNLSWTATAGYLIVLYNAALRISEKDHPHPFAWPLGTWIVSVIAYLFVYTQFCTIMAISRYIKQIDLHLGTLLGSGHSLLGESAEEELGRIPTFHLYLGGPCPELAYLMSLGILTNTILVFGLKISPP